jgi:hypothetical protein
MTGLTRSCFQTPLCLRQQGTPLYLCFVFRSQSEKRNTRRRKSTAANDQL